MSKKLTETLVALTEGLIAVGELAVAAKESHASVSAENAEMVADFESASTQADILAATLASIKAKLAPPETVVAPIADPNTGLPL